MSTRKSPASPRVAAPKAKPQSPWVARPKRLLIGGQWVAAASDAAFPTFNPATGEPICQVPAGDKADIDRAVADRKSTRLNSSH